MKFLNLKNIILKSLKIIFQKNSENNSNELRIRRRYDVISE